MRGEYTKRLLHLYLDVFDVSTEKYYGMSDAKQQIGFWELIRNAWAKKFKEPYTELAADGTESPQAIFDLNVYKAGGLRTIFSCKPGQPLRVLKPLREEDVKAWGDGNKVKTSSRFFATIFREDRQQYNIFEYAQ